LSIFTFSDSRLVLCFFLQPNKTKKPVETLFFFKPKKKKLNKARNQQQRRKSAKEGCQAKGKRTAAKANKTP